MTTLSDLEQTRVKLFICFNIVVLIFQGMIRLDFVVDAACVGLEDPIKGHVPVGFIVIDKSKLSANAVLS